MKTTPSVPPLARSVTPIALDWDDVEPEAPPRPADNLGLSPEDRAALGLSAPRHTDLWHPPAGDAKTALAEILGRGAAYGRPDPHARRQKR